MKMALFLISLFISSSLLAERHPLEPKVEQIAKEVAKILNVKIGPKKELPHVLITESFDDPSVEQDYLGLEITGTASNWFIPPNLILLGRNMKLHNLAHELVHYFQYNYLGYTTPEDAGSDDAERDAVNIQNQFR